MFSDFRLDDVFEVSGTKYLDAGKLTFIKDGINIVGRTDDKNGIQGKIAKQSFEPNEPNTITATVIGNYKYVKFQTEPYYCSQNINKLKLKSKFGIELNYKIALFLMTYVKKFVELYNGQQSGYKLSDLSSLKLKLPVDTAGNIDFKYMEDCIDKFEQSKVKGLDNYLNAIGLNDNHLTTEDTKILNLQPNLKSFLLKDIFKKLDLKRRKKKWNKKKDTSPNANSEFNLPLVNAKAGNNGIMYYGRSKDWESANMSIDIIQNGAIATGLVYAQPQATGVLWDAYLIHFIPKDLNEEQLLYFATAIRKVIQPKYNYYYKATWSRVQNESIELPVNDSGQIDLDYMEKYIKAIKKQSMEKAIKYKNKIMHNL